MRRGGHIVLLLVAGAMSSAGAQEGLDQTFMRRYNLGAMQGGLGITTSPDGGFVATGQHQNNGSAGGCDVFVYKVDACGNRDWFKLYGTEESEGGKCIEPTADGGYVIGGSTAIEMGVDGSGNPILDNEGFAMRIDAEGSLQWYHGFEGVSWVFDVQPMASGFVAIGEAGNRPVLLRLDAAGQVLWAKRYPALSSNPLAITPLESGGFVFVSNQALSGRDVEVARLDAQGNPLWMKSFGAGFAENEHIAWGCNGLVDEAGGRIVVLAPTVTGGIGGEDILLLDLDLANGSVHWSRAVGSAGDDLGRDLIFAQGGLALLGSSDGFGASALDAPDALSQDLAGQDILLAKLSNAGYVEWARTYGGDERDKAVGVRYDESLGYTLSAYTSSSVFGNADGSMDPLFIRAGHDGMVSCQSVGVTLVSIPVPVTSQDLVASEVFSTESVAWPVTVGTAEPEDVFQCHTCYNEPQMEAEVDRICLGDTVRLINTTEAGLRCYQTWSINGPGMAEPMTEPGSNDTVFYVPSTPGSFSVSLISNCPGSNETATLEVVVHEVNALATPTDAFNGQSISCAGAADGAITCVADGGHVPTTGYVWSCVDSSGNLVGVSDLSAGLYSVVAVDELGCSDTNTVSLVDPPAVVVSAQCVSDYNGYGVSCHDAADGMALLTATGGVPSYAFPLSEGVVVNDTATGLSAGWVQVMAMDANGCTASDSLHLPAPSPPFLQMQVEPDTCGSGSGVLRADHACDVPPGTVIWPDALGPAQELSAFSEVQVGLEAGLYTVELVDANGCLTSEEVLVPATEAADVDFITGPVEVCFPGAEVDFQDLTRDTLLWRRWDFGDGTGWFEVVDGEETGTAQHTYLAPGIYPAELTVENADGCHSTGSQDVVVVQGLQVFVPSAFTPNNDGVNDAFGAIATGAEAFRMVVFDKWGGVVFETTEPDGRWNGSPLNAGRSHMNELFTWRLEAQGRCQVREVRTGTVQLIR